MSLDPAMQVSQIPVSAFQYYIWPPETVLIVRWARDIFQLDQSYKQTESQMQVTENVWAKINLKPV